jgi:PAS domain S-box-containing protein
MTEELRGRYEELLRLLVDHVMDYAIFIMDREGRVATWNAGAERLLGYRTEEILNQPFSTFFVPEEAQQHIPEKELEQAANTGRAADDRWAVRKDGSRLWVNGVTIALRDPSLRGFGKIMRDHTAQKQAHEQIQQLNENLLQKIKDHEQVMQDLRASQNSLLETIKQLEQFEDVVVGRELKMASLEKEVEKLRRELAQRN